MEKEAGGEASTIAWAAGRGAVALIDERKASRVRSLPESVRRPRV